MCVLCGEFVMNVHWTDLKTNSTNDVFVGEMQGIRLKTRIHRTRLCNEILKNYRLTLQDWNGSKYILSDPKGNQEIIHDLGTLWYTVEKLLGYPINPLDPNLLDRLHSEKSSN